jgi:xanthine dehydrogenase small subunit
MTILARSYVASSINARRNLPQPADHGAVRAGAAVMGGFPNAILQPMPAEPPVQSPGTLADAYALLAGAAGWRPIAGGTDLMVQITGELGPPPDRVLDLWRLDELRGISVVGDRLVIGALTTYTDIRRSEACQDALPALVEAAATIGAAQIQNRGTIGGNVMNASPAGDTLPVLLATDAVMTLGSALGERDVPAQEFWPAYRQTARRADELLLRVAIPLPAGRQARFRKIGTRRAQAISKVVIALSWRADGGVWRDVRVALGSVAATPIRARETEGVLEGAAARKTTADHAAAVLTREIHPIDDVRSTADYRRAVAARVLHRLLRDEGGW